MGLRPRLLVAALLALGVAAASNVVELNSANFDTVIGKGVPALVEYFAPWCGHCKTLAPIYEQLADAFAHAKDKVLIVKVDADGEGKEVAQKYGVTGFPTLKWFGADDTANPTPYDSGRDLEALAAFITEKTGVKSKIKAPPPPATRQLTYRDFDEVVYNEDADVIVAFTAPWCGHCKNMKPQLELVAENFATESNCLVANYDADAAANKPLAQKFGVNSYPTIKFFPKGSKDKVPVDYEGGRTEAAFTEFLNEKCGTQRAVGGGLNHEAGRHPELDRLASQFYAAVGDTRASIYAEAVALAGSAGATAKHYIKVMEKLANGTEGYIEKETARLASILEKRTLAPTKLDEIKRRANVLSAFLVKKAEEAETAVEDVVDSATDSAKVMADDVEKKAEEVVHKIKEEL